MTPICERGGVVGDYEMDSFFLLEQEVFETATEYMCRERDSVSESEI